MVKTNKKEPKGIPFTKLVKSGITTSQKKKGQNKSK